MRILRGLSVAIVLLLAVYAPSHGVTFLLTSDIRAQLAVVAAVSFALACSYLAIASSRNPKGMAAYGIAAAPIRHFFWALAAGITVGGLTRLLLLFFDDSPPFATDDFAGWQIVLLFWIAAPVQEEVIFRGLIQGSLETRINGVVQIARAKLSPAAMIAAALFALPHLAVGPGIALGALLLGLSAGQLRWVSGSLWPAILVHALFNIVGTYGTVGWATG